MNATPPEAKSEYSRALGQSRGSADARASTNSRDPKHRGAAGREPGAVALAAIAAGALLGAVILVVSEFTTLFQIHTAAATGAISSAETGAHHTYALIPIAVLVAVLAYGVWTAGSRPALLAIVILGVIALLIALLGDLPDAHASGLIGSPSSHFSSASATPSAGLYMETLGAVLLLIASVCGFLLLGPPPRPRRRAGGRRVRTDRACVANCLDPDRV
jgi:hypothetical protein